MAEQLLAAIADTAPVVEPDITVPEAPTSIRRRVGIWGLLLIIVIVFGYLTASRRQAIATFAAQVADIVRDFRGYDPEF